MKSEVFISEKDILDYVGEKIVKAKHSTLIISDNMYHHNAGYKSMLSIIQNGIHSLAKQNDLGIRTYSSDLLERLDVTTSHINGINGISLSKTNLTDLYPDEDVYNPKSSKDVDIIIDGIKAFRMTEHYGNEYICYDSISQDKFKALDIRILKLINETKKKSSLEEIKLIVEKINHLKEIANLLKQRKLEFPIREMSEENGDILDTSKIIDLPEIRIKK